MNEPQVWDDALCGLADGNGLGERTGTIYATHKPLATPSPSLSRFSILLIPPLGCLLFPSESRPPTPTPTLAILIVPPLLHAQSTRSARTLTYALVRSVPPARASALNSLPNFLDLAALNLYTRALLLLNVGLYSTLDLVLAFTLPRSRAPRTPLPCGPVPIYPPRIDLAPRILLPLACTAPPP
ncbi:hypothetical protein B0H13DRAFT_2358216 [Mycena leptocephala]|nr:hypothetical protein B0H13DRAFT_2358216 [Mycena leptocephala]